MDNENKRLSGKTVAILIANGFEEAEMTETQKALVADGATARLVSPENGLCNGWHEGTWGHNFYVEVKVNEVLPSQYDGLLLPGGERSLKTLLDNAHSRRIVKGMVEANKAVGVLSDGVELLAAVEALAGRTVTGAPQSREKAEQAGATWREEETVTDGRLVTSVGGGDLTAFIESFLEAVEGSAAGEREAA